MSGNDSSSDDEANKFKEAVDPDFFNKDLYNRKAKPKHQEPKLPPSLRENHTDTTSLNPFGLKISPGFQKHVSEHLDKILDEMIDDSEIMETQQVSDSHPEGGVRLFSDSKGFIVLNENNEKNSKISKKGRKRQNSDRSDDSEDEKKAKEAAVSPEWVLSQEETKHWAPNTKGQLEIIKVEPSTNTIKQKKKKKKEKKLKDDYVQC